MSGKKKTAFTLAEIMISVGIIGILAIVTLSITQFSGQDEKVLINKKQQAESLIVSVSKALASGDTTGLALTALTQNDNSLREGFKPKLNTKNAEILVSDFSQYDTPKDFEKPASLPGVELVNGTTIAFQKLNDSCNAVAEGGAPCALAYVDVNAKAAGGEKPQFLMAIYRDRAISEYELCEGYKGEKTTDVECPANLPNGNKKKVETCNLGVITATYSGVCCPSDQTPNGDLCVCKNPDMVLADGTCICKDNKVNINGACACEGKTEECLPSTNKVGKFIYDGVCNANGHSYTLKEDACKCPANLPNESSSGICYGACTGGKIFQDDICKCPSTLPNLKSDDKTCVAACAGNKIWNNDKCECPSTLPNLKSDGETCVAACIGNKIWKNDKCECPATSCATDGSQTVNSDCSCKNVCNDDQIWNAAKSTCISKNACPSHACPSGSILQDGICRFTQNVNKCTAGMIAITNACELAQIGNNNSYPLNGNYCLTANINLAADTTLPATHKTSKGWIPIGNFSAGTDNIFKGIFEGNDKAISNLKINRSDYGYQGLFGNITGSSAKVQNLGVADVIVAGKYFTGGLVGYSSLGTTINNCYVTGRITGDYSAGGLVGSHQKDSRITNSYSTASVTGFTRETGGLVGNQKDGLIANSYATGSVISNDAAGGLVGYNNGGTISNSYSTGSVIGNYKSTGGLIGVDTGTTTANYWDETTSGMTKGVGVGTGLGTKTAGVTGKTSSEMKSIISSTIYVGWPTDNWCFSCSNYPVLKNMPVGSPTATTCDISCATCPAPKIPNMAKTSCICPETGVNSETECDGINFNKVTCTCMACPAPTIPNRAKTSCQCPQSPPAGYLAYNEAWDPSNTKTCKRLQNVYIVASYKNAETASSVGALKLGENILDFASITSTRGDGAYSGSAVHNKIAVNDISWMTLYNKMSSELKNQTFLEGEAYVILEDGTLLTTISSAQLMGVRYTTSLGINHFVPTYPINQNFSIITPIGGLNNDYTTNGEEGTGGQIKYNGLIYDVVYTIYRKDTPLILDLKDNGFKFTNIANGVEFDLNADGKKENTGWTDIQKEFDDAFLVYDKNNNGEVDNGKELFGNQSGSITGFDELAKYDDNKDGVISKTDNIYTSLQLWCDMNKNGKTDEKELKTLEDAKITELSLNFEKKYDKNGNLIEDEHGNTTGLVGSFKIMTEQIVDGVTKLVETTRTMIDALFNTVQSFFG